TIGPTTLKLRSAYGGGIRPARTANQEATWTNLQRSVATNGLAPERQSGVEAGADLLLGTTVALHLTRFDQRASGLIQAVAIPTDTTAVPIGGGSSGPGGAGRRIAYELQNIGEIANHGWEMQSTATAGPLTLSG